ncbi:MAG: hypothetical protein WC321_04665 [Candidatus Omnitrophota bacterium]|jgi:hypothetical protein
MMLKAQGPKFRFLLLLISCSLFVTLIGCDAFVRKFTRKSKKSDLDKEEMLLAPEEYKSTMTKEELYRQYFLFWQSWQDELIEALTSRAAHKKQISCINEALKNLAQLRPLLNPEKQKKLDSYLKQLQDLRGLITGDIYGTNAVNYRLNAERLKRNILRDFSYPKIKDYLA